MEVLDSIRPDKQPKRYMRAKPPVFDLLTYQRCAREEDHKRAPRPAEGLIDLFVTSSRLSIGAIYVASSHHALTTDCSFAMHLVPSSDAAEP